MQETVKRLAAAGWLAAAVLCGAACAPKRIPSITVADLMSDRVTLDGVLLKCNANPSQARYQPDCMKARIAVERLAEDVDPAEVAKRNDEFERSRERLRQAQERQRRDQEARAMVNAYDLPVVPVDGALSATASGSANHPSP